MTKEEATMVAFEIVAYSGDARSKLLMAVEKAKAGEGMKVKVKKRASNRLKKGYPLIQKEDLAHPQKETTQWVELVDSQNQFIAKGYLGRESVGY